MCPLLIKNVMSQIFNAPLCGIFIPEIFNKIHVYRINQNLIYIFLFLIGHKVGDKFKFARSRSLRDNRNEDLNRYNPAPVPTSHESAECPPGYEVCYMVKCYVSTVLFLCSF